MANNTIQSLKAALLFGSSAFLTGTALIVAFSWHVGSPILPALFEAAKTAVIILLPIMVILYLEGRK